MNNCFALQQVASKYDGISSFWRVLMKWNASTSVKWRHVDIYHKSTTNAILDKARRCDSKIERLWLFNTTVRIEVDLSLFRTRRYVVSTAIDFKNLTWAFFNREVKVTRPGRYSSFRRTKETGNSIPRCHWQSYRLADQTNRFIFVI